jgi:hypothetical protein
VDASVASSPLVAGQEKLFRDHHDVDRCGTGWRPRYSFQLLYVSDTHFTTADMTVGIKSVRS